MVRWETQIVYVRIENGHKRKKFKDEVRVRKKQVKRKLERKVNLKEIRRKKEIQKRKMKNNIKNGGCKEKGGK